MKGEWQRQKVEMVVSIRYRELDTKFSTTKDPRKERATGGLRQRNIAVIAKISMKEPAAQSRQVEAAAK